MGTIDKQNEDKFRDGILEMTNTLDDIHNRAMVAYYDRESLKGTPYKYLLEEEKINEE